MNVRKEHSQDFFCNWSVCDLTELLTKHGVQISSGRTPHETLVRICEDVFGSGYDNDMEDRIIRQSDSHILELTRMNIAAKKIQLVYIEWKRGLLQQNISRPTLEIDSYSFDKSYDSSAYSTSYDNDILSSTTEEGFSLGEGSYSSSCSEHSNYFDDYDKRRSSQRAPSMCRNVSMLRRIRDDDLNEELKMEWRKPSWKYAKKYEILNRPHASGKEMKKINWRKGTIGRHCPSNGCGEQLDLWNEGQISVFSQYGSGITNYFKVRIRETNN